MNNYKYDRLYKVKAENGNEYIFNNVEDLKVNLEVCYPNYKEDELDVFIENATFDILIIDINDKYVTINKTDYPLNYPMF